MSPEMILHAQLFSSPAHFNLVAHPRLLSQLAEAVCPGTRQTLIYTAAGFGKTTLAVDWLKHTGLLHFRAYLRVVLQLVGERTGVPLLSNWQSPQLPASKADNSNAPHN